MDTDLLLPALIGPMAMAVVLVVAKLAADGIIGRNHVAGIRIPATLASDAAWQQGHRAAIRPAAVSLLLLLVAGLAALILGPGRLPETTLVVGLLVFLCAAFAWVMLRTVHAAHNS